MYQVLIVDDDILFLTAIEDALKRHARSFSCRFALGPQQAIELLQKETVDLIVSDLEMPGMNGELLLQRVSHEWPSAIRFLMTGRVESISAVRLFGVAQQVVAKDSSYNELFDLIEGALTLRDRIHSPDVLHCVTRFDALPMLPDAFVRITELLRKEDFHQRDLIDAVGRDPSLSAEVLRVANSAYFGARKKITNLDSALNLLGTTSIRNIIIFAELFRQPAGLPKKLFDVAQLWEHSVSVANIASLLAKKLGLHGEMREAAFSSGLLHDLGKIVLAKMRPTDYRKAIELANDLDAPLYEAEMALFGASHDEVGAYLLETWGFPLSIVDAVAYHHHELVACCNKITPLSIVAVANNIHRGLTTESDEPFVIEQFEEELLGQLSESSAKLWRGLHRAFE